MKTTHWTNVYGRAWAGLAAPGMAKHPAKYSRALIYRIVAHLVEQGYVAPGDTVLDPFGGVALGAIPLIERGIDWVGVELEEHFVKLAQSNIDLWNGRYAGHVPNWGRATIYWGDSRYLLPVVARARFGAVLGSPPYAGSLHQRGHGIDSSKYGRASDRSREDVTSLDAIGAGYGAVLGSPPYADSVNSASQGIDFSKAKKDYPGRKMHAARLAQLDENHNERRYGSGTGQLGAMTGGDFDAVLGSPPYADRVGSDDPKKRGGIFNDPKRANDAQMTAEYGTSDGQLGRMRDKTGGTFWSASRMIVEACYDLLRPGAVAVWVVKNYARNWELVPFAQRWLDLQIACGFEHIETIVASQVDNPGVVQQGLFGDDAPRSTRHGGLFRNLYEGKGGPVINSEMVYILKKPLT